MKIFVCILGLLVSALTCAADVTIDWTARHDPEAGWNLYYNHLQTPDALQYLGSSNPSVRTMTFHNIDTTGLYQLAITRVEYTSVAGVDRRTETRFAVVTILDGAVLSTRGDINITAVTITP